MMDAAKSKIKRSQGSLGSCQRVYFDKQENFDSKKIFLFIDLIQTSASLIWSQKIDETLKILSN